MGEIVWVITTCFQPSKETAPSPDTYTSYGARLLDYQNGIPSVLRYVNPDERVFITENTGNGKEILQSYGVPLHVTETQRTMFHENQGKKEFTDIVSCLNTFGVAEDAMVVKVTGRYILESDFFPSLVRTHREKDVVYSPTNAFKDMSPHPFPDCILGMIAMKARHWRALPLNEIKRPDIPTEWFFAKYIADSIPPSNRFETEHLDISVKIGSSKDYWRV